MRFAFIMDHRVEEVHEFASELDATIFGRNFHAIIQLDGIFPEPQLGWILDGTSLKDPSGEAKYSVLSKLKFLERFTDAELAGIEGFAAGTSPLALALRAALRKQQVAEFIDIGLPQTRAGVNNLVLLGLLTAERADVILNTPVSEVERYKGKV